LNLAISWKFYFCQTGLPSFLPNCKFAASVGISATAGFHTPARNSRALSCFSIPLRSAALRFGPCVPLCLSIMSFSVAKKLPGILIDPIPRSFPPLTSFPHAEFSTSPDYSFCFLPGPRGVSVCPLLRKHVARLRGLLHLTAFPSSSTIFASPPVISPLFFSFSSVFGSGLRRTAQSMGDMMGMLAPVSPPPQYSPSASFGRLLPLRSSYP